MKKSTKATLVMDNKEEFHFMDKSFKWLMETLTKHNGDLTKEGPIIVNNEFDVTEHIIYPNHISHIIFK